MTKTLFEPAALGGLKIENRMVRSATWEGIASQVGSLSDTAHTIEELAMGGMWRRRRGWRRKFVFPICRRI